MISCLLDPDLAQALTFFFYAATVALVIAIGVMIGSMLRDL